MQAPSLQLRLGGMLVGVGIVGLVLTVLDIVPAEPGTAAAVSMFLVIMGLVFYFPTLLSDDSGATSTMRVAVLMVISLFVVLTLKVGWDADSLQSLALDPSWTWVLAAALGGKAFQAFAENTGGNSDGGSSEANPARKDPKDKSGGK